MANNLRLIVNNAHDGALLSRPSQLPGRGKRLGCFCDRIDCVQVFIDVLFCRQ